ncbi:histidinol-phosphate transaminase, partial [Vibrio sp. 10N.222.51.A6]
VLAKDGIVTRNQNHEPALRNCVRISIGSQESMLEVITSLTRYQTELQQNQQDQQKRQEQQEQYIETQTQLDKDHI